jgi:hypothetical protein
VSGYSYDMSVRTRLSDHTMQTKFQSQRPSDVETPVRLFPLFEYRSEATSGQSVLGWVTALWDCVHPISKETAEQLLASSVVSHREEFIQFVRAHPHRGYPLVGPGDL